MSEQLSAGAHPGAEDARADDRIDVGAGDRVDDRARVIRVLVLLLAGAALGGVLAVLWEMLWEPPSGIVFEQTWYLDEIGLTQDISGFGWFVVLGLVGGLAYGAVAAKLGSGYELLTLVGVVAGSALAVWVMLQVGHWLGPPDPRLLAPTTVDLTALPGDLRLTPTPADERLLGLPNSAYLALPGAALIGLVSVFLGQSSRPRSTESVG